MLGDKLQSRYPEIEDWCAVSGYYEQFVRTNDQPVNIQMMFVRENFFRFFNFHLLEGNPETLLANENNIVLTRSCAIKLFGTEHALGKTLIEQAFGDRRCTVSGIIEDIDNSIFPSNIEAFSLHKNVRYVHWSASEENTQLGNAASCIFFLRFHPSRYNEIYMARFVSEIGTGPIGMDNGARIHVTAVMRAVTVMA